MLNQLNRRQALSLSAGALAYAAGGANPALAADNVTLMFDWVFSGIHAPFFYGVETGIFAKRGINLKLLPGTGSRNSALAVAAGHTTLSMVDATALPQAVQKGANIKAVYCYMPTTPFGIAYKKNDRIRTLADLRGRSYGDSPGTASYSLWPLFLRQNGLDPKTVKLVSVSPSSQWQAFRKGDIDTTYTMINVSYVKARRAFDCGVFAYADYGFNLLSKCVVARGDTLAKGDLVRRFNAALTQSVQAAQANPAAAVATFLKRVPGAQTKEEAMEGLRDTLDHRIRNKSTVGKPLGWMPEGDWQRLVEVLARSGQLSGPLATSKIYTNGLIA